MAIIAARWEHHETTTEIPASALPVITTMGSQLTTMNAFDKVSSSMRHNQSINEEYRWPTIREPLSLITIKYTGWPNRLRNPTALSSWTINKYIGALGDYRKVAVDKTNSQRQSLWTCVWWLSIGAYFYATRYCDYVESPSTILGVSRTGKLNISNRNISVSVNSDTIDIDQSRVGLTQAICSSTTEGCEAACPTRTQHAMIQIWLSRSHSQHKNRHSHSNEISIRRSRPPHIATIDSKLDARK